MDQTSRATWARRLIAVLLFGTVGVAGSGCAIDSDQLVTDVVQAALNSATTSLVDTLSAYLAGT